MLLDLVGKSAEDTPGWDCYHGYGRINAFRALSKSGASIRIAAGRRKPLEGNGVFFPSSHSGWRAKMRLFLFTTLALAFTCVPARPSGIAEPTLSSSERKVLEEYRLYCQPGRYFDEVRVNLDTMQRRHPESAFINDSVFLAEVHYLDNRYIRDGNGKRVREWGPEVDGTIFAKYPPSKEAWRQYEINYNRSFAYFGLAMLLGVSDVFFGFNSLVNGPPEGKGALISYRVAEFALPVGCLASFIYGWICAAKEDRALDDAFFESNGQAIAKRLAKDP